MSYTYITKYSFNLEDSELLQPYDVSSIVKKQNEEKENSEYVSLDYLDVWTGNQFGMKNRNTKLLPEILSMRSLILKFEKNQLNRTTDASKDIERYFTVCEICGLDAIHSFQVHMFHTAADILFEAEAESSVLCGKLFKLMKHNEMIQNYVMNYLHPDHLNTFLKQLRLIGFCSRKSFPFCMLRWNTSLEHLTVLLQYIYSLKSDYENVAEYVRKVYKKSLKDVIPENYTIERFDLFLLTIEYLDTYEYDAVMTMVWRSLPQAYLTSTEVNDILKKLTTNPEVKERILESIEDYNQIFIFPTMRPRSLKHYARTAFRKFYQIPEAVDNSNLPQSLKSYLKLQNEG